MRHQATMSEVTFSDFRFVLWRLSAPFYPYRVTKSMKSFAFLFLYLVTTFFKMDSSIRKFSSQQDISSLTVIQLKKTGTSEQFL